MNTWEWLDSGKNSYTKKIILKVTLAALPDFVKLAEAYGCVGIRANKTRRIRWKN